MTRYVGTAVAAVALLAGLVLAAPAGAAGRVAGGLTSLTLTSVGTAGPSTQAAIAADGRYAAFVSGAVSAVYLRDLISGKTTLVSDAADGSATAPDISANGRLISYEQDGDVFVADGLTVHQATGNSGDPRYAHGVPCPAALGSGRVTPCGPRISADGTTLAYPAELTPVPPELSITALDGDGDSGVPLRGDMLDLTPYSSGDPYGFPGGGAAVRYTDLAASPVPFTSVTVTEPPGFPAGEPFHLGQLTCTGTLSSGSSCTAIVSVDEDACDAFADMGPRLITGSLVTSSPIPAGQSVIELTALCDLTEHTSAVTTAYRTGTAVSGCPAPPADVSLTAAPATTSDSAGAPLSDVGSAEAGRPYVIWMPVSVPATADVSFAAANGDDCGIQLVNPAALKLADPPPASAPAPCSEGEQLTPSASPSPSESPSPVTTTSPPQLSSLTASPSSCTAYLLINPGPVTADAAFLGTVSGSDLAPTAYITVQGVRHVILARHDPAAAGSFATSPATVVSVASDGTELPGATEPSLSADGQYVAFAASVPDGASEVWLHDIGWSAVRPGSTTMVSCLPQPHAGHCLAEPDADSPSLSGSGQQVAFAIRSARRLIRCMSVRCAREAPCRCRRRRRDVAVTRPATRP